MESSCIYCGNRYFKDYLNISTFDYKRCTKCKLVQLVPMPKVDDLIEFYDAKYYAKNYDVNNTDRAITLKNHNQIQFDIVKRHYHLKPNTKFLDFGCGIGSFLDTLHFNNQHLLYGFEFNKISSGIIIKKGYTYLDSLDQNGEKFDVITLWDVAEHLLDPISTFKLLFNKLNENGILVIGTARIDDFVDKTSFGYTMWADPPAHTILYSKSLLKKILKFTGYKKIIIDNQHNIANIYLSIFHIIKRLIKYILLFKHIDKKNNRSDFGSYLVVIAMK